jgi:hypothetical protein
MSRSASCCVERAAVRWLHYGLNCPLAFKRYRILITAPKKPLETAAARCDDHEPRTAATALAKKNVA